MMSMWFQLIHDSKPPLDFRPPSRSVGISIYYFFRSVRRRFIFNGAWNLHAENAQPGTSALAA
jgi:hypothetical protein